MCFPSYIIQWALFYLCCSTHFAVAPDQHQIPESRPRKRRIRRKRSLEEAVSFQESFEENEMIRINNEHRRQ